MAVKLVGVEVLARPAKERADLLVLWILGKLIEESTDSDVPCEKRPLQTLFRHQIAFHRDYGATADELKCDRKAVRPRGAFSRLTTVSPELDPSRLRVCGRTYYAEPAVEPLPPTVGPAFRHSYGPQWIVTLCGASGIPEVSVSVAAYATDVGLENGR